MISCHNSDIRARETGDTSGLVDQLTKSFRPAHERLAEFEFDKLWRVLEVLSHFPCATSESPEGYGEVLKVEGKRRSEEVDGYVETISMSQRRVRRSCASIKGDVPSVATRGNR